MDKLSQKIIKISGGLTLCIMINNAMATEYSVGLKLGTMGVGVELNKPLNTALDLRLGLNYIEAQVNSFKVGSIEYDVEVNATAFHAVLDWYPKQNKKFYLSGGFLFNNENINPEPTPDFVFHGIPIGQALDRYGVNLKVDYGNTAPYIGIGYRNKTLNNKGWYYTAELGFAYLGRPQIEFNITDKATGKTPSEIPQEELDKELVRIKNKIDNYKVWPIVSFAWVYRF